MSNNQNSATMEKNTEISIIDQAKKKFEIACKDAESLQIVNNYGAVFTAVIVVKMLREALTDDVMKEVFMPLMNTKIGFLTDRNGRPNKSGQIAPLYAISIVRDAIIDAVAIGLMPTGNQMNIIAERMYPTKEGYTYLLKKLGVKYFLNIGFDNGQNAGFAEIPVKINYDHNGDKNSFTIMATVKKDSYSSHDQLRGKAERRAKKSLYEYITGCDFGDADTESSVTDVQFEDVTDKVTKEKVQNANKETISTGDKSPEKSDGKSPEKTQSQQEPKANTDASGKPVQGTMEMPQGERKRTF